MKVKEYVLVQYRDAYMPTYTFFWISGKKIMSPYFNDEESANEWLSKYLGQLSQQSPSPPKPQ